MGRFIRRAAPHADRRREGNDMMARISGLLLGLLILASAARSGTMSHTFSFEPPMTTVTGGRAVVSLAGARTFSQPGTPALPVYPAVFVLPPGERIVSVEAVPAGTRELALPAPLARFPAQRAPGHEIAPVASLAPAGVGEPPSWGELVTEQTASGIRFAWIALHPCHATGEEGHLLFSPALEVTIVTAPDPGTITRGRRGPLPLSPADLANPGDLEAISGAGSLPAGYLSASPRPYVIVTSSALAEAFGGLAALREQSGLRTEIVTTEWIEANCQGADLQERIRSFITTAWADWGTEFVLLGGDEQIIPHRGMYVKAGEEIEPDIPCDLYYSCLDGDWNADGDQYWGEPGEEDLLPEVSAGRLPVDTPEQVRDITAKLAAYALSPPPGRCSTALMLGELLWSIEGVDTWGGDSKDEVRAGSSAWGFQAAGLPAGISVSTLYDRDLGSWSAADLTGALCAGVNLVNHLGHANLHMVVRLTASDLPSLDNGGMPFVCYSQGCYPAAFDNRDDAGAYYAEDAIGEQLVTAPGGAVAFIGNTRLGWSAPGTTCGVSQFFDLQFFDALFGESIGRLGPAVDDSRIDNIAFLPYAGVRYVMYGLCLLGDPAMHLWTGEPRTLAVSHPESMEEGTASFEVFVSESGAPVPGALVSLMCGEPDIYFIEYTDSRGIARLFTEVSGTDTLELVVDACGCRPWSAKIPVFSPSPDPPRVSFLGIHDDPEGGGAGDGDGIIEIGETVALDLFVDNPGDEPITQASIHIATGDEWMTCPADSAFLGDLQPRSAMICTGVLSLRISRDAPDGHVAWFDIEIVSAGRNWTSRRTVAINAPGPALGSFAVSDTSEGNGNGCIEAWEFIDVHCSWTNTGSVEIDAPVVTLSCGPASAARVIRDSAPLADLPVGETAVSDGELRFFVRESTEPFTPIRIVLALESFGKVVAAETLSVTTCGFRLEDDAVDSPCSHEALVGPDAWHSDASDFHSAPGSWKCGGGPGEVYANMMDAALVTPPLCLGQGSQLTFWHRMEAEATAVYPYWAMDAGVVEISADGGGTWQILTPVAGYPCRAASTNTIFLPAYQRCWSGTIGWRQETVDLSAWTGPVRLRFHFASDEQFGFGGWYIDDISVTTEITTDAPDTPPAEAVTRLLPPWPNPFNPAVTIAFDTAGPGRVTLLVFDVAGRLVRTLHDGPLGAGRHESVWDGRDDRGVAAASGVYFCRLSAGLYTATGRLVLLR